MMTFDDFVSDAKMDRGLLVEYALTDGELIPTPEDIAVIANRVDYHNRHGSTAQFMDAQMELTDALFIALDHARKT